MKLLLTPTTIHINCKRCFFSDHVRSHSEYLSKVFLIKFLNNINHRSTPRASDMHRLDTSTVLWGHWRSTSCTALSLHDSLQKALGNRLCEAGYLT